MQSKMMTRGVWLGVGVALAAPVLALDLVREGKPLAAIILPTETEAELALKALPQEAQAKAAKVEDDELLAAEELQSIIEKISGAKLEIQRRDAPPAGLAK